MSDDLRSRQKELGRRAIVDACAELVTERRHLGFSMKEVAERAGVSQRTVYNHFATREELLDALGDVFDEGMSTRGGPQAGQLDDLGDLLAGVASAMHIFDDMGGLSEAFAQMPLGDIGRDDDRSERTAIFVDVIADAMPGVPADTARPIAILLRHVFSHRSWFWLTREYGLTTDQVTELVTWAIATLTDAAAAGDLPDLEEEP